MSKIVVFENLSLDGVMQAPGRPDEDLRGGFQHGGWAIPYADPALSKMAMEDMSTTSGALLLGRRTYEDFYAVWPNRTDNPFTEVLNSAQKYVASTTLKEPLPWSNSTLLKGDVPDAVAGLRAQPGKDIVVLGSGQLVQTLMTHALVDVYVLLIHPLVLGSGSCLFAERAAKPSIVTASHWDGSPFAALRLVDAKPTTTGVVIATYQPVEPAR
jgi:dihydrofolate reductase